MLTLYKSFLFFVFFPRRLQVGSNQAESSALSFVKVAFRSQLSIAEVSSGAKLSPDIDLNCQRRFGFCLAFAGCYKKIRGAADE